MKIPFVDLSAQYQSIKSEIDTKIQELILKSSFIGGEEVKKFEASFASYIGLNHCISAGNGTDTLEMILQALGIGPGDEVIVPVNSWISTAEVVSNVGAKPVFIDVIPGEYNLDPDLIENLITEKTKAIIPVHLYGLPARMNQIISLSKKHNLKVIEDSAQAHGAAIVNKNVGTFGDATSFSFYPGKNLGAYGDGGAILTNNAALAKTCAMISNHGQLSKHNHEILGRNSRLDTIQAGVLNVKLQYLNKWTESRIQNASVYSSLLQGTHVITPSIPSGFKHVFHLYVIQVENREDLIRKLSEEEIGYAIHYPVPIAMQKVYKNLRIPVDSFKVAQHESKRIISLPMFPELSLEQIEKVVDIVKQISG